jgi:hypothetical protein
MQQRKYHVVQDLAGMNFVLARKVRGRLRYS